MGSSSTRPSPWPRFSGQKLRKLRDEAGLSQAQLAEAVNYSNDTISKVETAAQAPSAELATRLDAHFGTGDTFQELQPLAAKEGTRPSSAPTPTWRTPPRRFASTSPSSSRACFRSRSTPVQS
ncbi:XRE family transcriptional regulator [Actinomadura sp. KC345]|uniref:helix-turn-helix transcriptional regulator n=1 Tax=Actinomadura sp. KC345 TaxID=2530371 RepID=UPI00105403D4|nr:helix-turn-helix transcriptional regulator [Actinomadura sp. KC345]TDC55473.1 XRE family transcriptional regulator [Actinomadura sp. KC345]